MTTPSTDPSTTPKPSRVYYERDETPARRPEISPERTMRIRLLTYAMPRHDVTQMRLDLLTQIEEAAYLLDLTEARVAALNLTLCLPAPSPDEAGAEWLEVSSLQMSKCSVGSEGEVERWTLHLPSGDEAGELNAYVSFPDGSRVYHKSITSAVSYYFNQVVGCIHKNNADLLNT